MYPPPTTSSDFGMSGRSSAAVESITRGSSTLSAGGMAGIEPVARIACSKVSVAVDPLDVQRVGVANLGVALDVLHLAELGELAGAARQPLHDVVLEVAELRE